MLLLWVSPFMVFLISSFARAVATCLRNRNASSPAEYACWAISLFLTASASRRWIGRSASFMAGDLSMLGGPMNAPQMLGISIQSVFIWGLIAILRPRMAPSAVIAVIAG